MDRSRFSSVVVYLDDFLIAGPTRRICMEAFNFLLNLLHKLGFQINWAKVVDPCQKIIFLGYKISTILGTLSMDVQKVESFHVLLVEFLKRKWATRKQLERLARKLMWAATIILWGRLHTSSTFDLI